MRLSICLPNLRLLCLICFISCSGAVAAQNFSTAMAYGNWHVQSFDAIGNYFTDPSFKKSTVILSDGSFASVVRSDGENWGVVKMSAEGKQLWITKTKGEAAGIAFLNDNIIVIYKDDHKHKKGGVYLARVTTLTKEISAVIINSSTGKIIKEKVIHTNSEPVYTATRVLTHSDGRLSSVLMRVTSFEKSSANADKVTKQMLNSERILHMSIDSDLNLKTTEVHTPSKEQLFMGAESTSDGGFYFVSVSDDQIVAEQFSKEGKQSSRLAAPISLKKFYNHIWPVVSKDPFDPNIIYAGLAFSNKGKDACNQVFEFNFSTKKVAGSGEQELSRRYEKTLDYVAAKGTKTSNYKSIAFLKVADILATRDRIAIVKEIATAGDEFVHTAIVIEIYDRKWSLLKTIALDRDLVANTDAGHSLGMNLNESSLQLLIPTQDFGFGRNSPLTLYAKIDLEKAVLEEYKKLDRGDLKKLQLVEAGASVWKNDGVLAEFLTEKGGLLKSKKDYDCSWQKISFK